MAKILSRRGLFGIGAAFVAAPAIVRVGSLMPISVPKPKLLVFTITDVVNGMNAAPGFQVGDTFTIADIYAV